MGANLLGGSPVWQYRLGHIVPEDNHKSIAGARARVVVHGAPFRLEQRAPRGQPSVRDAKSRRNFELRRLRDDLHVGRGA
jgi:hypothetical protein